MNLGLNSKRIRPLINYLWLHFALKDNARLSLFCKAQLIPEPSKGLISWFASNLSKVVLFSEASYKTTSETWYQGSWNTYLRHSNPSASFQEILHISSALCHCKFRLQGNKMDRHRVFLTGRILKDLCLKQLLINLFAKNSSHRHEPVWAESRLGSSLLFIKASLNFKATWFTRAECS